MNKPQFETNTQSQFSYHTRSHINPLTVQFWFFGLDTLAGDLVARGFGKNPRPVSACSKSSLYIRDQLYLHASGLWLADTQLLYHRGRDGFYHAENLDFHAIDQLKATDFGGGLAQLYPLVLEHELWIAAQHGCGHRQRQLAATGFAAVGQTGPPCLGRMAWRWAVVAGCCASSSLLRESESINPRKP
jgi:hypothetical protein